jgi:hypothetical protein
MPNLAGSSRPFFLQPPDPKLPVYSYFPCPSNSDQFTRSLFPQDTRVAMKKVRFVLVLLSATSQIFAAWLFWASSQINDWPETRGRIESSRIDVYGAGLPGGKGDTNTYVPHLRYSYSVNGVSFSNDRITLWDSAYSSWRSATQRIPRPGSDGTIAVYYDPNEPTHAVLSNRLPVGSFALLVLLACVLLMLAVLLPRLPALLMRDTNRNSSS